MSSFRPPKANATPSTPAAACAPWWRGDRLAARLPALRARERIRAAWRQYFAQQDFIEVDTPALQITAGLETNLTAFGCTYAPPFAAPCTRYLHTSPELAMKKLLAGGMTRIYQLGHVFRNEPHSRLHHPEFSMLEWYRTQVDYRALFEDCRRLLETAYHAVHEEIHEEKGGNRKKQKKNQKTITYRGVSARLDQPWQILTVREAFARYAAIDLPSCRDDPATLAAAAEQAGIICAADDTFTDIFFKIFLARIEPNLGSPAPTLLTEYPAALAALARPKADDPTVVERFELYLCGIELANAFGELTDPTEHERRLAGLNPLDPDFMAAVRHGLPTCAGCALGFDRLVMILTGAERIQDVLWAPVQ
ncbi:MAG: EF-P lysine aminoacylase EpmA [Pseudomonadota bacterium]